MYVVEPNRSREAAACLVPVITGRAPRWTAATPTSGVQVKGDVLAMVDIAGINVDQPVAVKESGEVQTMARDIQPVCAVQGTVWQA